MTDHCRSIYRVGSKDYVLDDAGILTRRYAFCVREGQDGAPKLKDLPTKPTQRPWKFSSTDNFWNNAMKAAVSALKADRATWHQLSTQTKVCLAYINYANNGKIGVCLSSTAKRIRDNAGKAFVHATGYARPRSAITT